MRRLLFAALCACSPSTADDDGSGGSDGTAATDPPGDPTEGTACTPGEACSDRDGCRVGTCDAAGACEELVPIPAGDPCDFGVCTANGHCVEMLTTPVLEPAARYESGYGGALAINADHLVVASSYEYDDPIAYILTRNGDNWAPSGEVEPNDEAIYGLALAGDDLFVGTPFADPGVVRHLRYVDGAWVTQDDLAPPPEFSGLEHGFGYEIVSQGDTLLVSGTADDGVSRVVAYARAGATWSVQQVLAPPPSPESSSFGTPMVLSGERAILGDSFAGAFHYYERTGGQWQHRATEVRPYWDLAFEGDLIAVGDHDDEDKGYRAGAVTLMRLSGAELVEEAKLYAVEPADEGFFGLSVLLHQGKLYAHSDGEPYVLPGLIHVFEPSDDGWELAHLISTAPEGYFSDFGDPMVAHDGVFLFGTPYESTAYFWHADP